MLSAGQEPGPSRGTGTAPGLPQCTATAFYPPGRCVSAGRICHSSFGNEPQTWHFNQLSSYPPLLQAPSVAPAVTVPLAPVKLHDRPTKAPTPQALEVQEGPPSPLSEASSGYFSHSVSSATLSDAFTLGLDGAAAASGQTPGSPPPTLLQATPETELPLPPVAPAADGDLPARPLSRSCLLSLPVPAKQDAWGDSNGSYDTKEPVFSEKEEAGAPPTPLPTYAPQKESCSQQSGGEVSPATERLGRPEDREKPASGSELDVSKPQVPPDLLSQSPAPASPFRIQKVRTSELKSFTRMLGGDPSCSSAAEEDLLASGALGDGGARAPALGKLEVSSDSEEASEVPEWLKEGEYVTVGTNKMGIVRYIGPTDFQEGTWVGVELDLPSGEWCCLGLWFPACSDSAKGGVAEECWPSPSTARNLLWAPRLLFDPSELPGHYFSNQE